MSWLDSVKNDMIIVTGDGQQFKPLWVNASRAKEWNLSRFEFPNLPGTLYQRGEPQGAEYRVELYFTGENHLDEAQRFWKASDDSRNWQVIHPFYGTLIICPIKLEFDNREGNVTKILGSIAETISGDGPKVTIDPTDKILSDKELVNVIFADSFVSDIPIIKTADKTALTENTNLMYQMGAKIVKLTTDAQPYFNLFNKANAAVQRATIAPLQAVNAVQDVINYPAQFVDTVQSRVSLLVSQFNALSANVSFLTGKNEKKIYENNAGMVVTALCQAAVTQPDYASRAEVQATSAMILAAGNQYLLDLDTVQDDNGGAPDSYIADGESILALTNLVLFTIANLVSIAKEAKQERTIFLEHDSNLIILTHRFFGIDVQDAAITQFIKINNIGLNEYLQIRKGRAITYYV